MKEDVQHQVTCGSIGASMQRPYKEPLILTNQFKGKPPQKIIQSQQSEIPKETQAQ